VHFVAYLNLMYILMFLFPELYSVFTSVLVKIKFFGGGIQI